MEGSPSSKGEGQSKGPNNDDPKCDNNKGNESGGHRDQRKDGHGSGSCSSDTYSNSDDNNESTDSNENPGDEEKLVENSAVLGTLSETHGESYDSTEASRKGPPPTNQVEHLHVNNNAPNHVMEPRRHTVVWEKGQLEHFNNETPSIENNASLVDIRYSNTGVTALPSLDSMPTRSIDQAESIEVLAVFQESPSNTDTNSQAMTPNSAAFPNQSDLLSYGHVSRTRCA